MSNTQAPREELLTLIAESYQVIGILANECGRFDDPHVIKALDNLAAERMVHKDVLPFPSTERTSVEYFIMPEVFRAEVCQGFDPEAVCKVLAQHECLTVNEPGRWAKKAKLPGLGSARCYHIPPRIFEVEA